MVKQTLLGLVFTLVIIGGFVVLNKANSKPNYVPQHKTFTLGVQNNKLVSGPATLNAVQGDTVTIAITADTDGELHLHGYDKHVDFKKGKQATLIVVANTSGHFPYELEDTKTEIGALDVLPK